MAVLHKADFIYENITQRHRLFRVFPKEVRSNSFFHHLTHHQPLYLFIKGTSPNHPRGSQPYIREIGTSSTQVLIIPLKLFYDLRICHQVVHNRGHGFSKRFIPAGVYNVKVARFPRDLPASYPCVPSGSLPTRSSLPGKAG